MNDQPNPAQFRPKSFGAPPASPTGASRMLPWMRTAMTGGLIVTIGMYGAQILLPDSIKPSVVMGWAAGDAVRAEIEASRAAKIDLDRRIADATAQAHAKAQADVIAITKAVEERTASLAPVSAMAGLADFACIGAQVLSSLTRPQGWGSQSGNDWYFAAQKTGAATCGIGTVLRDEVTRSQLDSVRAAAAARGAPMTDGATQAVPIPLAPSGTPIVRSMPVAASAPALAAPPVPPMDATTRRRGQLRIYSYRMPPADLDRMAAGLDMHHGYPDTWYQRVAAYQDAHGG